MTHPGLQINQEEVGDFYLFIVVEHEAEIEKTVRQWITNHLINVVRFWLAPLPFHLASRLMPRSKSTGVGRKLYQVSDKADHWKQRAAQKCG